MWMQRAFTFIQVRISGGRQEECGVRGVGGNHCQDNTVSPVASRKDFASVALPPPPPPPATTATTTTTTPLLLLPPPLLLLLLLPGSSVSFFGNVFGFGFLVLVTESALLVTESVVLVAESDVLVTKSDVLVTESALLVTES